MLAGDVAQALGQLSKGGGNLDPLGGAGEAVALAGAVLAVLALDPRRSCWTSPRRCSASAAVAVVGAHDLDAELELTGELDPGSLAARPGRSPAWFSELAANGDRRCSHRDRKGVAGAGHIAPQQGPG